MFEVADIHPEELGEDEKEHSSRAGRLYARTGGVSEAVRFTVKQLNPERKIEVRAEQADGVPACRAMIERLKNGETTANFFEGMGCLAIWDDRRSAGDLFDLTYMEPVFLFISEIPQENDFA